MASFFVPYQVDLQKAQRRRIPLTEFRNGAVATSSSYCPSSPSRSPPSMTLLGQRMRLLEAKVLKQNTELRNELEARLGSRQTSAAAVDERVSVMQRLLTQQSQRHQREMQTLRQQVKALAQEVHAMKKLQEDAKEQKEDSKKPQEDSKKRKDDTKKQKEDSKKQKEDSKEQKEDTKEQKEDSKKQKEDSKKLNEDTKKPQEDTKKLKDDTKKQKDDTKKQKGDSKKQKDDTKKQKEDSKKLKEDPKKPHSLLLHQTDTHTDEAAGAVLPLAEMTHVGSSKHWSAVSRFNSLLSED